MIKIFAVNSGSSSLKFQLVNMPEEEVICSGIVERIGFEDAIFTIKWNGQKVSKVLPVKDHTYAVSVVIDGLMEHHIIKDIQEIEGVGHRIVQGGDRFDKSVLFTEEAAEIIKELAEFAPLHNMAHLSGFRGFKAVLPNAVHVAVFDTAYHQTITEEKFLYAVPYNYYTDYKIRKYGAHGTSHKYISGVVSQYLGKEKSKNVISCHLGSGSSICAIKDGKSFNISMGFTPLAGIMMGTRSGDVDPSIIPYICKKENITVSECIDTVLNKKSGLQGISQFSSDMRDIEARTKQGDKYASLAYEMFATRTCDYVGSFFVELGECDALVFTAGIGENSRFARKAICDKLAKPLGIKVDEDHAIDFGLGKDITAKGSKMKVLIIPTNEEIMIARDTYAYVLEENEKKL